MYKVRVTSGLAFSIVAGALSFTTPSRAAAQGPAPLIPPPSPHVVHHLHYHEGSGWPRQPAIPRTYSYYYDTWFNQPRHLKVLGPGGRTYWKTTLRGLPGGTPWSGR